MWLCYSWTYRPLISIVMTLVLLTCAVRCSEQEDHLDMVERVYPRRNHWAVGHLMGKKSIDHLREIEDRDSDRDSDYRTLMQNSEDQKLRRSKLLPVFLSAMLKQKTIRRTPLLLDPFRNRQTNQKEKDRLIGEVTDLLSLALDIKESSSS